MRKEGFIHTKWRKRFMKNTYELIWSDEALSGLKDIIDYLANKFSEKEVKKFDKQIDIIRISPETFPLSHNSNLVRRSIVAKLTSIYYWIDGNKIKLVSIYDNRKNPDSLKI